MATKQDTYGTVPTRVRSLAKEVIPEYDEEPGKLDINRSITPNDELIDAFGLRDCWDELGPQAQRIISDLIPAFVERFVSKSLHYGPKNANRPRRSVA